MNKNWFNDARVSCKAPNNLLQLIIFELDSEHELDEFGDSFEQDELKKRLIYCSWPCTCLKFYHIFLFRY